MPYGTASIDAIDTSGNLSITGNVISSGTSTANTFKLVTQTLGAATAGNLEYDGSELYFTPVSTQRGLIPNMQYFVVNNAVVGANANTAQSVFGAGVTLSSNTVYAIEYYYVLGRTAGTTAHTLATSIGGTATYNSIGLWFQRFDSTTLAGLTNAGAVTLITHFQQTAATIQNGGTISSATFYRVHTFKGVISVNTGGTFIPQYICNNAPGGAYSTLAGSYCLIYPLGGGTNNISVGTWA